METGPTKRTETTMNRYQDLKDELLKINQELFAWVSEAKSLLGMSDGSFGDWEKTCSGIEKQLSQETIRVAVVGAIKSGKSTFVNSLFNGDYLKRGAGVVTSIVTRVRSGPSLNATLFFKSWGEINSEIEQALVLFPSLNWRSKKKRFEIRREKERSDLQQALAQLSPDQFITKETKNANSVLLGCYLKGYETVK